MSHSPSAVALGNLSAMAGMGTLATQIGSLMGYISPIIGVLAGIATIVFFTFSLWESHALKARLRLRRRKRLQGIKLKRAAQEAELRLKHAAEIQALAIKQQTEQTVLKIKHGEAPNADKLSESRPGS